MEADGDHFLAFYLTKEDDVAAEFKVERLARSPDAPEEDEVRSIFPFSLQYRATDCIVWGSMGAYYKNIERKMLPKKKRQVVRLPSRRVICVTNFN